MFGFKPERNVFAHHNSNFDGCTALAEVVGWLLPDRNKNSKQQTQSGEPEARLGEQVAVSGVKRSSSSDADGFYLARSDKERCCSLDLACCAITALMPAFATLISGTWFSTARNTSIEKELVRCGGLAEPCVVGNVDQYFRSHLYQIAAQVRKESLVTDHRTKSDIIAVQDLFNVSCRIGKWSRNQRIHETTKNAPRRQVFRERHQFDLVSV